MPPAAVSREFVADLQGLAALDDWIERSTSGWTCGGSLLKARVCAAELAANVMEHGSAAGAPARISVRLASEGPGVRLELEDDGRPFDPTHYHPADSHVPLQTAQIGGRGIRTVQGLARELKYLRRDGRNLVSVLVA